MSWKKVGGNSFFSSPTCGFLAQKSLALKRVTCPAYNWTKRSAFVPKLYLPADTYIKKASH